MFLSVTRDPMGTRTRAVAVVIEMSKHSIISAGASAFLVTGTTGVELAVSRLRLPTTDVGANASLLILTLSMEFFVAFDPISRLTIFAAIKTEGKGQVGAYVKNRVGNSIRRVN